MFSTADKTVKPAVSVQRKAEQAFFGPQKEQGSPTPETPFFKPAIQPKLKVNKPDDAYEKEADLVADRVVNMPEPQVHVPPTSQPEMQRQEAEKEEDEETLQTASTTLQRMADEEQEDDGPTVQTKRIRFIQRETSGLETGSAQEDETIQTYSNQRSPTMYPSDVIQLSGRGPPAGAARFQSQLHNSTSGGRPMAKPVGDFMASRFGADFSGVRIHTDASAQQMSKQVNAHAFTYQNHIYFNSGKYDPASKGGQTLLAHELTHTIQQGASPVRANVQRKHSFSAVQRKTILQRQVAPQLTKAVELAEAEQGKVIANKEGADGYRYGWEHLMEYFETTFGKDKIVSQATGEKNIVPRQSIKRKSEFTGNIILPDGKVGTGKRDAMPSWCGIFAFWALNKAGIPMPKWQLGKSFIPPEAAYPKGHTPKPGDIAYKELRSHYGLVVGMEGANRVKSVNGNTAGDDNLGGEIQVQTHDLSNWQGFFNPLVAKTGNLRDPSLGDKDTEPKTLDELLKAKYGVSRKAENGQEEEEIQTKTEIGRKEEEEETLQAKTEASKEEEEETLQAKAEQEEKEAEDENIQRSEMGSPGGFASNGVEYEPDDGPADIQTKSTSSVAAQVKNRAPGPMIQGGWLGDAWNAVSGLASDMADLIEEGIDKAKDFLIDKVLGFVDEIPGYTLLSYILGKDPIKGTTVDKTPLTLLDAVLDLIPIGGELVRGVLNYFRATNPVANWLFDSVKRFSGLIKSVGSEFKNFWNRLSISDVGNPERVMNDVANLFRSVIGQVITFVSEVGKEFLKLVKEIAITNLVSFVKKRFPDAYDLLIVILGEDPITEETVDRNGTNILNAGLKVLGARGAQIKRQMEANGIFAKCVGWIDRSIHVVFQLIKGVKNSFAALWKLVSFETLKHPLDAFAELAEAFAAPILLITSFISDAMRELLAFLREALLNALSNYAKGTRGYFLVTVLIGKDPFTGNKVPRNTENIIHGFFSLMDGGEAQFQQMKESGAIDRMSQKISAAVKKLNFTWDYIVGLFTELWESFDWTDFLIPGAIFIKILKTFADPIRRLVNFITVIIKIAIEILMVVMNFPVDTVNNIIARSMEAFGSIKRDPIGFLKNILRGIKQGFVQFFDNILKHLLSGLGNWLFGSLGELGIQMPPDLSFKSILNLVLQILGISVEKIMERVWAKLTEKIGPEKVATIKGAIDKLTGIWSFVKDVIDRGPIAIWEYVQEKLSDLWNIVIDAAKGWIMTKIIGEVTAKLLSMLDPTGIMAVINSVIAIYRAIQSFIEQLRAMLEILNSFVNGIAEIAAGNVQAAADYLEGAMARGIPVLIGFLANQVGLGGIGKKIAEVIGKVREKITAGIDWLVAKALKIGMPIINGVLQVIEFGEGLVEKGKAKVKGAIDSVLQWWKKKKNFRGADGKSHKLYFAGNAENSVLTVASEPIPLTKFLEDKEIATDLVSTKQEAVNLSAEIDGIKTTLKVTNDNAKIKELNGQLDVKMAALIPKISLLMGGNGKSVQLLEIYLNSKVTDDQGAILPQFIADLETDKNKVDDKKVYGLSTRQKDNKTETKVVRQSGMAGAKYLSIAIVEGGMLMPSPEKAYVPDHKNYIPDTINISEKNGTYTAKYDTKTFEGTPGPTFTIEISFAEVLNKNEDNIEQRIVAAENLVFKPEGNPRGVTDSAGGGFDNAHLIGDRFGGSGKNKALNIYPSSPNYNRKLMLGVEDRMAAVFSSIDKFNLTVTAQIKEEKKTGNNLKNLLLTEFEKDNANATESDQEVQKELSSRLQTEINKDIKELPGKFLSMQYSSPGEFTGQLGADPDYDKSVKEFEKRNVNT
ncbi:DUF4157 domain-containing protein [Aggregatimonas sangjinii]|uniref:DUF4157 domain-containing protein n=1 Tax=Aggregatimonas sangjinii TaxID=2583587 RepID=A0A5B7SVB5_9FLAO|nr:DUF4157 domain-containing protein [Aggregatimonas sangjinii]QCX00968.1 DUF4157 domain-containing protein [Aggregatimonas sangjinii]